MPAPAPEILVGGDVASLSDTMQIGAMMDVIRLEGLDYGATLEAEMFPDRGGAQWRAVVGLIYDAATMRRRFDAIFAAELAGDTAEIAEMQAFFGSERGQRILTLELQARRALLDDATQEAARVAVADMIADQNPRMAMLRRFAETNDLIESNVTGALNANLAFYQGLSEAGAFGDAMTEEQMLLEVWSQEDNIRADTNDWLFPFLALAYEGLSDEDMAAYLAFSETAAGRKLNVAAFVAFDALFTAISRDLGRAAARHVQGEDI
ncbi:MAG: DUF2059 domain-containing protein [Pseudorhodobacter sp.]|nr:DUF2059 domain-containing protein [Pseudorhodobacter sp.]